MDKFPNYFHKNMHKKLNKNNYDLYIYYNLIKKWVLFS